jgi:hypothetical protein
MKCITMPEVHMSSGSNGAGTKAKYCPCETGLPGMSVAFRSQELQSFPPTFKGLG